MVDKLSNYILDNVLYKNEKIEGDQREIMLFGVTRILEDIPKYIVIFLLSYFLHILSEVAIVLCVSFGYKTLVGGAHASTNISCLFSSMILFFLPVVISKYVNITGLSIIIAYTIVFVFSIYVILRHAPADTEEIPILNKNRRKILKISALISLILIYLIATVVINDLEISKLLISSVLLINIFATNPVYKLYKCKHSYESEEFKEYFNK